MRDEEYLKKENKDNLNRAEKEISEIERTISEYKKQNNIECITEEELTEIFGGSILPPDLYYPYGEGPYVEISYSDGYLLSLGINPFEGWEYQVIQEYLDEIKQSEDGIELGDVEQLSENDQFYDLRDNYYDDLVDKYYGTSRSRFNLDIKSVEEEVNDENFVTYYGYDLGNADSISQGEWECELQDDQDYFLSLRTKTVDSYVADMTELDELLHEPIHETIMRQIIHMEVKAKRFLIVVNVDEQYIFYNVFLQPDNNSYDNLTILGWDVYPESALHIINYYLETGLTMEGYQ